MPEIIFDNCVLSNFAMSDSLHIIENLYAGTSYVTDFVAAENTRGILKGYKGLLRIREAARKGWLKETTLKGRKEKSLFESLSVSLGLGEASSIAVAKARDFTFACDDRVATREAAFLGVKLTETVGILVKAARKKIIGIKEADGILKDMVRNGFYSPVDSVSGITRR